MSLRRAYETVRCPAPYLRIGDGCAPAPGISTEPNVEPLQLQGFGLDLRADLGVARPRGGPEARVPGARRRRWMTSNAPAARRCCYLRGSRSARSVPGV